MMLMATASTRRRIVLDVDATPVAQMLYGTTLGLLAQHILEENRGKLLAFVRGPSV